MNKKKMSDVLKLVWGLTLADHMGDVYEDLEIYLESNHNEVYKLWANRGDQTLSDLRSVLKDEYGDPNE